MEARLRARPLLETGFAPVGLQPLMFGAARDSYLYVPTTYRADRPAPLVLLLHGAGGHARQGLDLLRSLAHSAGLILLAPPRAIARGTCSSTAVMVPTRP
jgi:phospholipase/carboxylesterase